MKFLCIFFVLFFVFSKVAYADTFDGIKRFCAEKWGADYSMQKYCRDKENDAYFKVLKYQKDHKGKFVNQGGMIFNPYAQIVNECTEKWKRVEFTEWSMVNYCLDKQTDAYEALQE